MWPQLHRLSELQVKDMVKHDRDSMHKQQLDMQQALEQT